MAVTVKQFCQPASEAGIRDWPITVQAPIQGLSIEFRVISARSKNQDRKVVSNFVIINPEVMVGGSVAVEADEGNG